MKQKWKRYSASLLALLLCVTLLASTAFAAGGALGADRNGTPYTYVIGYMYSGSSQTVNTREIFTSPNNYDIWLCPVCGRDPLGNSQGTALSPNLYMPCVPFPVSWTVKMKKKQKETQDILSYHTQAAGCSDKARAKASGGRQPIEECGRTGL